MRTILTLISFFYISVNIYGQRSCEELLKVRDTQLSDMYDKELKKYQLDAQTRADWEKNLEEISKTNFSELDKTWQTTVLQIGAASRLLADLISNIPIVSETGPGKVLKVVVPVADMVVALQEGKTEEDLMFDDKFNEGLKYLGEIYGKATGKPLAGQAVSDGISIAEYALRLKEIKEYNQEADDLIKLCQEQLKTANNMIARYNGYMNNSKSRMDRIMNVKNAIDKYCGGKPIIKVIADLDCNVSIDFGDKKFIAADGNMEFSLDKGEHFISFESTDGKAKRDTTINLTQEVKGTTIYTLLKQKVKPTCPVLFIADANCEIFVDDASIGQFEKDKGKKVDLEFGEHNIRAKESNSENVWKTTLNIDSDLQKVIKTELSIIIPKQNSIVGVWKFISTSENGESGKPYLVEFKSDNTFIDMKDIKSAILNSNHEDETMLSNASINYDKNTWTLNGNEIKLIQELSYNLTIKSKFGNFESMSICGRNVSYFGDFDGITMKGKYEINIYSRNEKLDYLNINDSYKGTWIAERKKKRK